MLHFKGINIAKVSFFRITVKFYFLDSVYYIKLIEAEIFANILNKNPV